MTDYVADERRIAGAVREHHRWRVNNGDLPIRQRDRDLTELAWALTRGGMYKPELAQVLGLSLVQLERVLAGKRA